MTDENEIRMSDHVAHIIDDHGVSRVEVTNVKLHKLTLVDSVHAAINFGMPDSKTLSQIMEELRMLYAGDPAHPTIARVEQEAYRRGEANEADRLVEQTIILENIRQLVTEHVDDDCATNEADTLLKIAKALGYRTYGYGATHTEDD